MTLALVLAGCSLGRDDPEAERGPRDRPGRASDGRADDDSRRPRSDAGVAAAIQRELDRRTAAVREGDRDAWLRRTAPDLADQQATWFANLRELPVAIARWSVTPADLVRDGRGYWAVVTQRLQLDGYDAAPVTTRDRWRFVPTRHGFRLTSVTDPRWEAETGARVEPWETTAVRVREAPGVLAILDPGTVDAAGPLLRELQEAIADVAAAVPPEEAPAWGQRVVVYALSTGEVLSSLPRVPGGDPDELDAAAFPVVDDATRPAGRQRLVATRLALQPRVLDQPGPVRERLLRHELTHVALGTGDDVAPVWLIEGLAEWVSTLPTAPARVAVPEAAVAAGQRGVSDLPADETFNDDAAAVHYGVAWAAVGWLADHRGAEVPWQLLAAVRADPAHPDQALRALTGLRPEALARRAGQVLAAYADLPSGRDPDAGSGVSGPGRSSGGR